MKDKSSRTAADVVALRALSSLAPSKNRILVDDLSMKMLPRPWGWSETLFSRPSLRPIVYHVGRAISNTLTGYRGTIEMVALRYRHIDDRLHYHLGRGIGQVVLLGAGFDYRAHRPEFQNVSFIEIDHPRTQGEKQRLIGKKHFTADGRVKYAAVDFQEDWAHQLKKAGVIAAEPTLVIWEGVSYYLTEEAVHYTLDTIRRFVAAGSILIFDSLPSVRATPSRELLLTAKYVAKKGEPLLWGGTVPEVRRLLELHGYQEREILRLSSIAERLRVRENVEITREPILEQFFLVEAAIGDAVG